MDKRRLRSEQFPVTRNLVYFNHAAVGPLPAVTAEAVERQARDQRDFGALHWREWDEVYSSFRRAAAALIGADPSEISILKNTSEGISFVANGLRLQPGDNVLTTDAEFPSNWTPWKRLERKGVECRVIPTRDGVFAAEDVESRIDRRTRVVAISSVGFHTGFAADLEAIGEVCARKGVHLSVDAIQSLGVRRLDVRRAKISFLSADGHKWLLAPEGAAIFYCRADLREELEVLESGWMNVARKGRFIGAPTDLFDDGRRFEAGALNTTGARALTASLELLASVGYDDVEREVLRIASLLADRLDSIGCEVRSPRPIASGIVSIALPQIDPDRLAALLGRSAAPTVRRAELLLLHALLEREGIVCSPREGMLRFSPHFYNDESEIERVVEVMRRVLSES